MGRVTLLKPETHRDTRGWFCEAFSERAFAAIDPDVRFVQDNHSFSAQGVLRGLHFQRPPHAQAKLVRCVAGAIWDVAVDVRAGSPTYGRHVAAELSAANGRQLYVPIGFAHGFLALTPGTEVIYKVSDYYAPETDGGLCWNDPDLALPWPSAPGGPILSEKDAALPRLSQWESPFAYDGAPLTALEEA